MIHDQVRELRQAALGVLDAAGAHYLRSVFGRRTPEHGLIDPVGFADELRAQAESVEHLHRAARDAVGLTDLQRGGVTLDESRADAEEGRKLRGQQHTGGTAAYDQDVDGFGKARRPFLGIWCGGEDVRITGRVAVEIELHCRPPVIYRRS